MNKHHKARQRTYEIGTRQTFVAAHPHSARNILPVVGHRPRAGKNRFIRATARLKLHFLRFSFALL